MYLSELSLWGIVPILLLAMLMAGVLWLVDRRLLRSIVRPAFWRLPSVARLLRGASHRSLWLLLVVAVVLVGALLLACCLLPCLPQHLFWPVAGVMVVGLLATVPRAFHIYIYSLRRTGAHRRYLLSVGARHIESVVPSARRALRAALLPMLWRAASPQAVALPLLFFGLVMGGAKVAAALVLTLVLWVAMVAGAVAVSLLLMWVADRRLFDAHERLTVLPEDKS